MKKAFYRRSKFGPQMAYRIGLGPMIGRMVLLLTTTGRKSGLPRVTPLQYELIDDCYYVSAVFGARADWVRNLIANPIVQLRVKNDTFQASASVSTDPGEIADFIDYRHQKHPLMIGLIMRMDGFKSNPTREELLHYSKSLALVKLTPISKH